MQLGSRTSAEDEKSVSAHSSSSVRLKQKLLFSVNQPIQKSAKDLNDSAVIAELARKRHSNILGILFDKLSKV